MRTIVYNTNMRFVAIGRSQALYRAIDHLKKSGHELIAIITDVGAPEYTRQIIDFKKMAKKEKVPILVSSSAKKIKKFLSKVGYFDVGISVNHRFIITENITRLFPNGILNLHGGDLPRYKGNACQAWAILNGEDRIGACVYRIEPNILDEGSILARRYLEVTSDTKIGQCISWIEEIGPEMFLEAVNLLQKDPTFFIERSGDSEIPSLRCYERRPEDGLIDWDRNALDVVRLVNASGPPYFGAFCYLDTTLIKILEAKVAIIQQKFVAVPGQVIEVNDNFVVVACRSSAVSVFIVDYEGQTKSANEVLRSTRMRLSSKKV